MKASRLTAVGLVAGAGIWILSGYLLPHESAESHAAARPGEAETQKPFRVAVAPAAVTPHRGKLILSGRTEADRKIMVMARTSGTVTDLRVRRGSRVKEGDVIAVLSDDAREAQVAQARALVAQRREELDARSKLIASGSMPRLELGNLQSQLKSAEAGLAVADAERARGVVTAPWSGVVNELSVEVGQAAFSFQGREIAQIVALDPMLAVAEVAERKLGGIKVGDTAEIRLVTGETAKGRIRYVAKSASPQTRTYRVEVEIANADGAIPDGITAELRIPLAPVAATGVPRSALTFSSAGDLGVRIVDASDKVGFTPVEVLQDDQTMMWVRGIADGARVIVEGQDFVREGQRVEAVPAADMKTARE